MSGQDNSQTRLRIHFGKRGPLRYTSHLDLARVWERLLRRAGVDLVYSQGFNPRPKIQLAAALPLGYTSTCEVLDIWLADAQPPSLPDFVATLQAVAPDGLDVQRAEEVPARGPALQTLTLDATYHITFLDGVDTSGLQQAVTTALAAPEIIRERRNKRYDLRPLILNLELADEATHETPTLVAILSLGEAATGRPDEVLAALGLNPAQAHVERVAMRFAEATPQTG